MRPHSGSLTASPTSTSFLSSRSITFPARIRHGAERKAATHPGVRRVEPATAGAAHHAVPRVGDAGRPLLPRCCRRGRAFQDIDLAADAQADQKGAERDENQAGSRRQQGTLVPHGGSRPPRRPRVVRAVNEDLYQVPSDLLRNKSKGVPALSFFSTLEDLFHGREDILNLMNNQFHHTCARAL